MKTSLTIIFVIFLSCSSTKYKCNSITDIEQKDTLDKSLLSEKEAIYLNKIFETTRNKFDFNNKKVGFIKGSSGGIKSNKQDYFDMQNKHCIYENYPCDNGGLYIFNSTQKKESGGYDAAIVYWSKFVIPAEKIIKRLKKNH